MNELTSVKLGDESFSVLATGNFKDSDTSGYIPNPESEKLRVDIPNFDGPLDLLLFLIKRHSLNVVDIPIVLITEKYLEMLEHLQSYDFDIAGEFIFMAATLAQIKSRMLLPRDLVEEGDGQEDEEDPRAALVRQLIEYQKFKAAADVLGNMHQLGKDFFKRSPLWGAEFLEQEDQGFIVESCHSFDLLQSFAEALKKAEPGKSHTVHAEQLNISAYIRELMDFGKLNDTFSFDGALAFLGGKRIGEVVVAFLAVLEMARLGFLRVEQEKLGEICLYIVRENLWAADKSMEFIDLEY